MFFSNNDPPVGFSNGHLLNRWIPTVMGFLLLFPLLLAGVSLAQTPFTIQPGLLDQANTEALGLSPAPGTETFNIYRAAAPTNKYSNGVALVGFKGHLYAQWQSSPVNEDSPDTWVAYSRSADGQTWTPPMVLAANPGDGYRSSGGWWVSGDTLVAYINRWPASVSPRGGYTEYTTSTDGLTWAPIARVTMADGGFLNGIFEQDPHALPGGRIINAAHFQPGLKISPIYTDDPSGVSGWVKPAFINMSYSGDVTREIEPSWFYRSDGAVVMIFRDQNSNFFKLAAVSTDSGQTWSTPVPTTVPDSRSKQSAGNLPDGTAYIVSNPAAYSRRSPLVMLRSRNGSVFDKGCLMRRGGGDLPTRRYDGTAKTLGYSYPKSAIWNGYLYAGYSVNKEDVECTRVPLTSIQTVALAETPAVLQAEAASSSGGVTASTANAGYRGAGFTDFPTTGGSIEFTNVNGGAGGQAVLTIRYANGGTAARAGNLVVNGVAQPVSFEVTTGTGSTTFSTNSPNSIVAAPASWTAWTLMDLPVTLASGSGNTIRFTSTGQDLGNIDEISVTPAAAATVTIAATDASAGEFGADASFQFAISRTGATTNWLTVPLAASGSATPGDDFTGLAGGVVIPAGQAGVVLTLAARPDEWPEGPETVDLSILPGLGLVAGVPASASATISDKPSQDFYFSHIDAPAKRAPGDDADGDSTANVIEYFAGTDPGVANRAEILTISSAGPAGYKVRFPRAKDRPDVGGALSWSPNLEDWYASGQSDGIRAVTFAEAVVSVANADPETVEATATITGPGPPNQIFVRLGVN